MATRDGRKIRLHYHVECFTGEADPRTQEGSSATEKRLPVWSKEAPQQKGAGKWSVNQYGLPGARASVKQKKPKV